MKKRQEKRQKNRQTCIFSFDANILLESHEIVDEVKKVARKRRPLTYAEPYGHLFEADLQQTLKTQASRSPCDTEGPE